jgi:hypothetical protein
MFYVLNACSPVGGTACGGGGNFRRYSLARGSRLLGE